MASILEDARNPTDIDLLPSTSMLQFPFAMEPMGSQARTADQLLWLKMPLPTQLVLMFYLFATAPTLEDARSPMAERASFNRCSNQTFQSATVLTPVDARNLMELKDLLKNNQFAMELMDSQVKTAGLLPSLMLILSLCATVTMDSQEETADLLLSLRTSPSAMDQTVLPELIADPLVLLPL